MGMLKGKVVGEAMAIAIAEIGAQGAERTFCVLSKDENGVVSTCEGSYGYLLDDGTIVEGDVRNADLEKAFPIIAETGVARPFSVVRGHFRSADGKWVHIDTGMGNHFFIRDLIGKSFLEKCAGQDRYFVYQNGIEVAKSLL